MYIFFGKIVRIRVESWNEIYEIIEKGKDHGLNIYRLIDRTLDKEICILDKNIWQSNYIILDRNVTLYYSAKSYIRVMEEEQNFDSFQHEILYSSSDFYLKKLINMLKKKRSVEGNLIIEMINKILIDRQVSKVKNT